MMFEFGNRMPRITWFKLPFTCGADASGAVEVGAGAVLLQAATNTSNDRTVRTRIDATSKPEEFTSGTSNLSNPTRAQDEEGLKTL
jgi:hypothetical protein